ncbi:hypothetical protein E2C01_101696 [Portunus trituberculatus]|uniref:Uncharacterized protein n=1 Tax=Portunus trituberculatus TaxID=210409 RepID=A0A5B7KGI5_PORTR|nr:hypothetical protein [Portunus trituberculatus]
MNLSCPCTSFAYQLVFVRCIHLYMTYHCCLPFPTLAGFLLNAAAVDEMMTAVFPSKTLSVTAMSSASGEAMITVYGIITGTAARTSAKYALEKIQTLTSVKTRKVSTETTP